MPAYDKWKRPPSSRVRLRCCRTRRQRERERERERENVLAASSVERDRTSLLRHFAEGRPGSFQAARRLECCCGNFSRSGDAGPLRSWCTPRGRGPSVAGAASGTAAAWRSRDTSTSSSVRHACPSTWTRCRGVVVRGHDDNGRSAGRNPSRATRPGGSADRGAPRGLGRDPAQAICQQSRAADELMHTAELHPPSALRNPGT
jgi:hypothetical protein